MIVVMGSGMDRDGVGVFGYRRSRRRRGWGWLWFRLGVVGSCVLPPRGVGFPVGTQRGGIYRGPRWGLLRFPCAATLWNLEEEEENEEDSPCHKQVNIQELF